MSGPPVINPSPVTAVYPGITTLPGLDIAVVWRPKAYNFPPQTTPAGREVIVSASPYTSHEFDLTYNCLRNRNLTEVEFRTLMGFWLQVNGTGLPFLFSNPWDSSTLASPQGSTVSGQTQYTLLRSFGASGFSGSEPIGVLDTTQTFNVYANGVLKASSDPTYGYGVDLSQPWNQLLVFNSAPPAGVAITVDMTYYYLCRFGEDKTEFEQVLYNVWQNRKVTLVSKKGY